jgi:hypothetical protein
LKLFLGIPSAGTPAPQFVESLAKIVFPPGTASLERAVITGNYVPAQRDLIVERALERGAGVLIMCDDDMVLEPSTIATLCEALTNDPTAALAGALYYSRDGFRPMAVDRWDPADTRTAIVPGFDREPVAVDGVGFGCVAIRTSSLQAMVPPYFAANVYVERGAGRVRVCNEDYLFCARLREAGARVLLVPGARCLHYDRASGRSAPAVWEPPDVTRNARMAVIVDGKPALVPMRDVARSTPETHVRAALEYIVVP